MFEVFVVEVIMYFAECLDPFVSEKNFIHCRPSSGGSDVGTRVVDMRVEEDARGTQVVRKYVHDKFADLCEHAFSIIIQSPVLGLYIGTAIADNPELMAEFGTWERSPRMAYLKPPFFEARLRGDCFAQYLWKLVGFLMNAGTQVVVEAGFQQLGRLPHLYSCGGVPA